MLIDTHCHLNFSAFKRDWRKIIEDCLKAGIWMINVGTKFETSKRAIEIAKEFKEGVYCAIGLHPIHLETGLVKIKDDTQEIEFKRKEEDFDYKGYKELAKNEKVVAIGEIGLDYYFHPKSKKKMKEFKEKQKMALLNQLELGREMKLPIIFHCRFAHQELINLLSDYLKRNSSLSGVVHCFTGTWEEAQKYLKMGLYLGFNGIIFKRDLTEVIEKTPLERMLLETDAPYLHPLQKRERNTPFSVKLVAEKIAEIKKVSFEKVALLTFENAKRLFRL